MKQIKKISSFLPLNITQKHTFMMTMTALTKFVKILPPGLGFYTLWWSQHGHILKMCNFSLIPYILEENYFSTFNAKRDKLNACLMCQVSPLL